MRRRVVTALGGALLATMLLAPTALAAPPGDVPVKATPNPFEGELPSDLPGCFGNLNATFNHGSGIQEHGKDSKGPGFYFRDGQAFQEAKDFTRALFCASD